MHAPLITIKATSSRLSRLLSEKRPELNQHSLRRATSLQQGLYVEATYAISYKQAIQCHAW
jgi:hypothetical protein